MIAQIKNLRVEIDGLYQLTKNLLPEIKVVSTNSIPPNQTIEDFIRFAEETGMMLVSSTCTVRRNSAEIEEAAKSLILAKAWLDKMLAELNVETPYSSGKKTVTDIEPTADTAKTVAGMREPFTNKFSTSPVIPIDTWELNDRPMADYDKKNHIEKVDYIREEIQKLVDDISKWYTHSPLPLREASIARTNAYTHLCEAKMWLGFEFARIRESNT